MGYYDDDYDEFNKELLQRKLSNGPYKDILGNKGDYANLENYNSAQARWDAYYTDLANNYIDQGDFEED